VTFEFASLPIGFNPKGMSVQINHDRGASGTSILKVNSNRVQVEVNLPLEANIKNASFLKSGFQVMVVSFKDVDLFEFVLSEQPILVNNGYRMINRVEIKSYYAHEQVPEVNYELDCTQARMVRIKGSPNQLYFISTDEKRHAIPQSYQKTILESCGRLANVEEISEKEAHSFGFGINATVRANHFFLQQTSGYKIWEVFAQGQIREIDYAQMKILYGEDWHDRFVRYVPDVFFSNYTPKHEKKIMPSVFVEFGPENPGPREIPVHSGNNLLAEYLVHNTTSNRVHVELQIRLSGGTQINSSNFVTTKDIPSGACTVFGQGENMHLWVGDFDSNGVANGQVIIRPKEYVNVHCYGNVSDTARIGKIVFLTIGKINATNISTGKEIGIAGQGLLSQNIRIIASR